MVDSGNFRKFPAALASTWPDSPQGISNEKANIFYSYLFIFFSCVIFVLMSAANQHNVKR